VVNCFWGFHWFYLVQFLLHSLCSEMYSYFRLVQVGRNSGNSTYEPQLPYKSAVTAASYEMRPLSGSSAWPHSVLQERPACKWVIISHFSVDCWFSIHSTFVSWGCSKKLQSNVIKIFNLAHLPICKTIFLTNFQAIWKVKHWYKKKLLPACMNIFVISIQNMHLVNPLWSSYR